MNFGPQNAQETQVFAVEELRADIQYEILRMLRDAKMTQAQLAQKLGCSSAAVSQFLGDDANLTIETVAKVFSAFGRQAKISSATWADHVAADGGHETATLQSAWQFDEPVLVEHISESSTAKLMEVFRETSKRKLPSRQSNDNGSFYQQRIERVA